MTTPLPEDIAIRVSGVSKAFRLPQQQVHTLKERVLHPTRGRRMGRLDALNDVSFEIRQGEFFGIVGRNGSGKSTLMKCMAGIYRPDGGEIWARGRIAPFIELGVGFNPDLTARDNVVINAVMLGLSRDQARERYASIIDFAELTEFQDLPLKNYSSGMQVRLAFSVMVHVDADVLLIDEVLAVGDASFQQKCHDALNVARDAGKTILLVTHQMEQVQRFCDRALLLERGNLVVTGDSRTVSRRYTQMNFATAEDPTADQIVAGGTGDGAATIVDTWTQDAGGTRTQTLEQGRPCSVAIRVRFEADVGDPIFGVTVTDEQHRRILVMTSEWEDRPTGAFRAGDIADVWTSLDNWLAPGRYFVSPQVTYPGGAGKTMAAFEDFTTFVVTAEHVTGGAVDVPHSVHWRVRQPDAEVAT